ncbi:MAG TPA: serine/threonine-protein kinase [Vicinamibacteria bacterium]|nr:serine/threonine-protein kinase [Vicinamibacteria bacterium]
MPDSGFFVPTRSFAPPEPPPRHPTVAPRGLPSAPPRELSRRLTLTSLTIGAGYGVALLLTNTLGAVGWEAPRPGAHGLIAAAIVGLSAAVAWVSHRDRMPPGRLLNLGLAYEVLVGLGMALQDNLRPTSQEWPLDEISWLALLIVMFPLLVPASPARTLAAGLVTASMWPLAFWVSVRAGNPVPPASAVALNSLENYIAAALALVPAVILRRLTADVQEARRMGSYQLIEPLGHGGMGEVWRARHDMLARPAAIKLVRRQALGLTPGTPNEAVLHRFEREAQATAALHSPHTVELYDFGVTADGTFYYVMELLEGLDLQQLVTRFGPVPPARAVHFLLQLCDSLADAHHAGLIHRDVKPANVYACRRGLKYDFVKLFDFGLVKPAWRHDVDDSSLTQEGATPGTPAYLAPEVALGSVEVDGRVDLYAAGCVMYWLLTGRHVFEARTPLQMAVQHAQAAPVPPSQRIGKPIPAPLEAVVMSCLEKAPDRRPSSADELAGRLVECGVAPPWSQEDARAWWRANVPPP